MRAAHSRWVPPLLTAFLLAGRALAQSPALSDHEQQVFTLWDQASGLVAGCGCCCFWLFIAGAVAIGLLRGSWLGVWFWEIAAIRAIGDAVGSYWARIVGRRRLEEQLRARTANPRDSRARYNLGVVYMEQRRWDRAAEELKASLEINPDRADAHYRLARCQYELGQLEHAVEAAAPCLGMRDDHYDALLLTGECLLSLDRIEEARGIFDRFLQPRRDDVAGWYWRGRVEEAAGDSGAAARWYHGAIERARHTVGPNRARDRRLAGISRRRLRGAPPPSSTNP